MDKKLFTNYFYNILYQVFTILVPLITVSYTTRVLGDALGVNAFSGSVVQWFVIFGIMGINNYGIKTVGAVRDDKNILSKTFAGIFLMQLINMLLVMVIYIIFISISTFEYKIIYFIQALTIMATMFDISWFYLGIEDFKINAIRNIIVRTIGIILIFLVVKKQEDLWLFVLINAGVAVLGQMIMFVQLPRHIDFIKVSIKEAYHEHFKENMILFVPQLATSVYNIMDQTLVGIFASDWEAQSAYYQQAIRFVRMFLYLITSIGSVIMPRISNVFHKGNNEQIKAYLSVTLKLAIYLSIPIMFGTAAIAPSLVPWLMDESFHSVSYLIPITCPIIILVSLSNVFGIQYLLPTGKTKAYSTTVVIGAVVNLISNAILIPKFGALGACISIVLAEGSVTLLQIIIVKKIKLELDFNIKTFIIYFLDGIIMCAVVLLIGKVLGPGLKTNVIQILAGVIVYLGLLTIIKDDFHLDIINKGIKLIKGNDNK